MIESIEIERRQTGWMCEICFTVTTANQFTDEWHCVVQHSRWALASLWCGWREYVRVRRQLAAKPGERAAKGWA